MNKQISFIFILSALALTACSDGNSNDPMECENNDCEIECEADQKACLTAENAYECKDIFTDKQNCGECANTCNSDEFCQNGSCQKAEIPPEIHCNETQKACPVDENTMECKDIFTDEQNCGECANACNNGEKCVNGICENPNQFLLKTKNAELRLELENNQVVIKSLKTNIGTEYIHSNTALPLPDCSESLVYLSAEKFEGKRTSKGYKFTYQSSSFTYELYVVSSESYSGPFEMYGYLTNSSTDAKTIASGNYFNMKVSFPEVPTATTFHKQSGLAEGYTIKKKYYEGTGIYTTKLGKTSNQSAGNAAKFEQTGYASLYFWTKLKDTSAHKVTFYAKGTKGEKFSYDYEDAHATVNGEDKVVIQYGVNGSYTFKTDGEWEPVTIELKSAYEAGVKDSQILNENHAKNGFPFRIYTTSTAGHTFWIDEVTINGKTQHFNGEKPESDWEFGSWSPNAKVTIDKTTDFSEATTGFASAEAKYQTYQDWNSNGDIPMMYIDTGKSGLYMAQEWTNGQLKAQGSEGNKVILNAVIGSGDFVTTLPKDQKLYYPSIYIGVYDGDIDDGSNLYKRWFLHCKAPENMVKDTREPLVQEDMQIGYRVADYGIQSIKWDYGWWTSEVCKTSGGTEWKCQEGLLELNNTTYISALKGLIGEPVTIKRFTDEAKKLGVSLTTYILLKDTGLDRDDVPTSKRHPEWFSDRVVTIGQSADLGNTEAVRFYQKYMSDFFTSNGVTTWRSDFEPICKKSDKANRHAANGTDVQYWATVGFGELVDYLIENVEGFRYESCSSGGAMKDMFTMTKASVINCNDSADYMSQHLCFYDTSYAIHPAQIQLPVDTLTYNYQEEYANFYTPPADYMYGLRSQITAGIMLSNGPSSPKQAEKAHWTQTIKNDYEINLKPLIRNGDLYHILPRPDGKNWDGIEYVDLTSTNKVAAIMLWKPTGAPDSKTIKLRGLDKNTNYKVSFTDHTSLNCTKSGQELMETGLTVTFTESISSDVIYLTL